MDIEQLYREWAADAEINPKKITEAAVATPMIHAKYMELYSRASLRLRKIKAEYKMLVGQKTDWYRGEMAVEDMKALGWSPNGLKVMKSEVPGYIERDPDVIKKVLQVGLQEEMAGFLENCLKHINNRNFLLKTVVDWERFQAGG